MELGFKSFESARRTLRRIEIVHWLRKNQIISQGYVCSKFLYVGIITLIFLIYVFFNFPNKTEL
jgi:hypothetical protein